MRKKYLYIAAILLLAFLLVGCKGGNKKSVNIVVVMDNSSSMSETDKAGRAKFASNMLVSAFEDYKIPLVSSKYSTNIGIVTYGKEAKEVVPLTNIDNSNSLTFSSMRDSIDNISYDDTTGTNYYAGLEKAMSMCESMPSDENIILVMSDGQFDLVGLDNAGKISPEAAEAEKSKAKQQYLSSYQTHMNSGMNYVIYTLGIDTRNEKTGSDGYADLKQLATSDKDGNLNHYEVNNNTTEIADFFSNFIGDIYEILNPDADRVDISPSNVQPKVEGSICTFDLDKKYKMVQILIAAVGDNGEKIKLKSIKSPSDDEPIPCQPYIETGKSKITIQENSGIDAGIYIENAKKGQWEIEVDGNAEIVAKVYIFNPMPWYVIPLIVLAVILLIIFIMWLLAIPPVRYRKKPIQGFVTIKLTDPDGLSESVICSDKAIISFIKNGKYFNKGNITVGTLLGNKKYKDLVLSYNPGGEFSEETLSIVNKGKRNVQGCKIYPQSTERIKIDESTYINIEWDN